METISLTALKESHVNIENVIGTITQRITKLEPQYLTEGYVVSFSFTRHISTHRG